MTMTIKSIFLNGSFIHDANDIPHLHCQIDIGTSTRKLETYIHIVDIFNLIAEAEKQKLKGFIILKNAGVKTIIQEMASHAKIGIGYSNSMYIDGIVVVQK